MPETVGEVRKLTGLLSYYSRYISDFAKIAKPLYDLLKEPEKRGQSPRRTQRRNTRPVRNKGQVSSREPVNWTSEHQAAIDKLISAISNPPVMAYPQYTQSFILHTDASEQGLARDEKLDLHSVKCLVKGAIKTAFVTALHAFDARQILSLRLPLQGGLRW